MPRIEGALRTETEDPSTCDGLGDFSCGDGSLGPVEDEIEELVRDIRASNWPEAVFRVTRELPNRRIVGVAAIEPRRGSLFDDARLSAFRDAAYVGVLALSAEYRCRGERYTCAHGSPLSDVLLSHTFRYLADFNQGVMPTVQAAIAKNNHPSRRLVERYGFEIPIPTIGAAYYVRRKRLALPTVAPDTLCVCLTGHESAPATPTS